MPTSSVPTAKDTIFLNQTGGVADPDFARPRHARPVAGLFLRPVVFQNLLHPHEVHQTGHVQLQTEIDERMEHMVQLRVTYIIIDFVWTKARAKMEFHHLT